MANFTESQAKACTILNLTKTKVGDDVSWRAKVKDSNGSIYNIHNVSSKDDPDSAEIKSGVLKWLLERPVKEVASVSEEELETGKGINETIG